MAESADRTPHFQAQDDMIGGVPNQSASSASSASSSSPTATATELEQQRLREEIAQLKQECQDLCEKDNVLKQNIMEVQERIHDEGEKL